MEGRGNAGRRWLRPLALAGLLALVGVLLGASVFTAFYAEAFSYMSDDPEACVNCHVMRPQFEGWTAGPHHEAATCNDCHVPHGSFVAKWLGKAGNGYHHSRAFTLQDFPDPIRITPRNAEVLEENCIRCHEPMVGGILGQAESGDHAEGERATGAAAGWGPPTCVTCHRAVGHGAPW